MFCVSKANYTLSFYKWSNTTVRLTNIEKEIYGANINVNVPSADDGRSFGSTRFYFKIFKGQKITVTNNQPTNNNWTCSIRNSSDEIVQSFSVTQGSTVSVFVNVDNGAYLNVYQEIYPLVGTIVAESVDEYQSRIVEFAAGVTGQTTDIIPLNYKVPGLIASAQKILYGQTIVPFSILHFSDPHNSSGNVKRLVDMAKYLGTSIDDTICTGDMARDKYADGFAWWGNIDGAEDILLCIGNHDVTDGVDYGSYGGTTPEGAYNTYFAPYINNWGVTHTGTLTYYYKDYPAKKIRLIVLDYLLTGNDATSQNAWLASVLSDARTNNYTVVIAQHCPVRNETSINCSFSMLNKVSTYNYPVIYQQTVQTFINDGGEFACYIVGHTHWDMVCYNDDYPQQICIAVTCATTTGRDNDQIRDDNNKSRDAANVVTVDTTNKTIKLIRIGADIDNYLRGRNVCTISYSNKSIIAEY